MDNKKLIKLCEEMDAFIQEEMSQVLELITDIEAMYKQIDAHYEKGAKILSELEPFRSRIDALYKDQRVEIDKVRMKGSGNRTTRSYYE